MKRGRKRKRRGVPQAPSGAGHISADRANRTDFRREGLRRDARSAGGMGYIFGSSPLVYIITGRKYKILGLNPIHSLPLM